MRGLAVLGGGGVLPTPHASTRIDGVPTWAGIVGATAPAFDPDVDCDRVLVRVRAFSCNYRDRALLYRMRSAPRDRFFVLGSEFCGEILAVGRDVRGLRVGDRVVTDHHYTGASESSGEVREGVVTNQASNELQVIPSRQLQRVPKCMPGAVGGGFSLVAQTAYSIVRRLDLARRERVLVTSARSSTSLAVLARLARDDVEVVASTTSGWARPRLLEAGACSVIVGEHGVDPDPISRWAAERGAFDAVVDPFFDLHLDRAIEWLRPGGRYITCGLTGGSHFDRRPDLEDVFLGAIVKNITIIGNCLGVREDLHRALRDYAAGEFAVPIDSTFSGVAAGPFLARTFNGGDRFGKVVFTYDDPVEA